MPVLKNVDELLGGSDNPRGALHLRWHAGLQPVRLRSFERTASCAAEKSDRPTDHRTPGPWFNSGRLANEPVTIRFGYAGTLARAGFPARGGRFDSDRIRTIGVVRTIHGEADALVRPGRA